MKRALAFITLGLFAALNIDPAFGQSLGNAGTIEGTVVDQSGAAIPKAELHLTNAVTATAKRPLQVLMVHSVWAIFRQTPTGWR